MQLLRAHIFRPLSPSSRPCADPLYAIQLARHFAARAAWDREQQIAQSVGRVDYWAAWAARVREGLGARFVELFVEIGDGSL
jgi:hypothetical protein